MNSLFKFGGGAGIGSYVIVIENGTLKPVRAEVVRESYDKGENLYLSIIDDSTEEALLPLSGYVDNEGILHLSGRDFDDNKTYEFTVNNAEQTISVEEKEGVTIGETTIPTSGGGGTEIPNFEAIQFNPKVISKEFVLELSEDDIDDIAENSYPVITISYQNLLYTFSLKTGSKGAAAIYTDTVTSGPSSSYYILAFAVGPNHMLQPWINEIPINGGGTQLYKHVIRVVVSDLPEATEPTETTCVIVNASSTSFTTINPGDWMLPDHFISGMVDLTPGNEYRHYSGIIQVTNESEPCFILCDTWGSPFKAFIGGVVSDTPTTL